MYRFSLLSLFLFVVFICVSAQADNAPALSPERQPSPVSSPVHHRAKSPTFQLSPAPEPPTTQISPAISPVTTPKIGSPLKSPVFSPVTSPVSSPAITSPSQSPVLTPSNSPPTTSSVKPPIASLESPATTPSNQPPEIAASTPADAPDIFPYGRGPVSIPSAATTTLAPETAAPDKSASIFIHHDVLFPLIILITAHFCYLTEC